jgi:hypothetical protein
MEQIDSPETSVRNYHYSLRSNPEERIIYRLFFGQPIAVMYMGPIGSPETSTRNYQNTLRNISQKRRSHVLGGGSLKSSPLLVPSLSPIVAQLLLPYFFNIHFNISSHLGLSLASVLFPSGFSIKMVLYIYLSRLNNSK